MDITKQETQLKSLIATFEKHVLEDLRNGVGLSMSPIYRLEIMRDVVKSTRFSESN